MHLSQYFTKISWVCFKIVTNTMYINYVHFLVSKKAHKLDNLSREKLEKIHMYSFIHMYKYICKIGIKQLRLFFPNW